MTLRPLLPIGILLALACGGGDVTSEAPQAIPPQATPPLEGYAYLPGPDGGASGARFSQLAPGAAVFVGVDDANLRDADGSVLETLRLGSTVTIVAIDSAPVEAIDRMNVWYRVRLADGTEGRLFGGLLTPFGGREFLEEVSGERGWAVTFAPDGRPRLRTDKAPGSDEAITLDLNPSDRFVGGRMTVSTRSWGDLEVRFDVMQCRLDGGAAPECSTATARIGADGSSLEQLTPPDPWQYAEPWSEPSCEGGTSLTVSLRETTGPVVQRMEVPMYIRGPDTEVRCFDIGAVSSGSHQGKTVTSCVQVYHEKSGEVTAASARYLRDDDGWIELPCASDMNEGAAIQAQLVRDRVRVTVDASISGIDGIDHTAALHLSNHTFPYDHHAPGTDRATLTPVFEDPALGQVYASTDALVVPLPDDTELRYRWEPTLSWSGDAPAVEYRVQTMGCNGIAERLINIEPEVSAADLETVTTLTDGTPVGRLRSLDHPTSTRLLSEFEALKSIPSSGDFDPNISREALLAKDPWLFIEAPWGQHVLLSRADLVPPAWCEPILYAYADPPAELHIAPRAPLSFFKTIPHAPDGWQGIAQPDGSVIVDGRRWPELFWEGRSGWFALPADGVVVAEADLAAYLTTALHAQGLQGHEVDDFLDAWLPDLEGQGPVWIGFHSPDAIAQHGPLDITPPPDTLIRVLMDATPTDAPPDWDGSLPDFAPVPQRTGVVVVEWGGMTRE